MSDRSQSLPLRFKGEKKRKRKKKVVYEPAAYDFSSDSHSRRRRSSPSPRRRKSVHDDRRRSPSPVRERSRYHDGDQYLQERAVSRQASPRRRDPTVYERRQPFSHGFRRTRSPLGSPRRAEPEPVSSNFRRSPAVKTRRSESSPGTLRRQERPSSGAYHRYQSPLQEYRRSSRGRQRYESSTTSDSSDTTSESESSQTDDSSPPRHVSNFRRVASPRADRQDQDFGRRSRTQPSATVTSADVTPGESVPISRSHSPIPSGPNRPRDSTRTRHPPHSPSQQQELSSSNRELIERAWEIVGRRSRSLDKSASPPAPDLIFPIPGLDVPTRNVQRPGSTTLLRMIDNIAGKRCELQHEGCVTHAHLLPTFRLLTPSTPDLTFGMPTLPNSSELRHSLSSLVLSANQLKNLSQKADFFLAGANFMDHISDSIDALESNRPWTVQDQADVSSLHKVSRLISRELCGLAAANAVTLRRLQREEILDHSGLPSPVKKQCRDTRITAGEFFSEEADIRVQEYKVSPAAMLQEAMSQEVGGDRL